MVRESLQQWRIVGGAFGGQAQFKGCDGINGKVSNTSNIIWKPRLTSFHLFHTSHYNEPVLL
jgi:hypothetical protein